MSSNRRDFLRTSAALGGALGFGLVRPGSARAESIRALTEPLGPAKTERAPKPLNMLIIGGTGFIGPHAVNHALARGHKVTLLNRDRRRPGYFQGKVTQLVGDLNADVSALKGKSWDVVLDNPTTFPAWVKNVAQYVKGNTKHYIYVSTVSVYADDSVPQADETDRRIAMPDTLDPFTLVPAHAGRFYGALKTRSEQEVEAQYPGINTIVRPGLIVGPGDTSDRFTWWVARIDRGGTVLAPGDGNDVVQYIDVRDLAEWMIRMAENREFGVYNACGPATPQPMAEMLYGIKAVTTADAHFVWVPADFLREQNVRPWTHMPVWIAPTPRSMGSNAKSIERAKAKGLTFRPLAVIAKDTLDYHKGRPAEDQKRVTEGLNARGTQGFGISPAREAEVIAAWRARTPKP